jgi:hypothetical protein
MAFPGTYNFNYYRGDTFSFIIRPRDASGDSYPLADFDATMTIANRRGAGSGVTQYEATAIVNSVDNIVTCTISDDIGRSLVGTTWFYDVEISDGSSIFTLLRGTITVEDDITGAI